MELIYAAMLLHKTGKEVNEENMKKILHSVDIKVDEAKIKALVGALSSVNIEEVIKQSALTPSAPAAPEAKPVKKEEVKEDKSEEAAAGLASLFG